MKPFCVSLIFLLLLANKSFGQSPIGNGGQQFNVGLGLSEGGIPVYATYEFGVHDDVTVGPMAEFNLSNLAWLILSARADYHFNTLLSIPQTWDFYGGANLGFRADFNDNNADDGPQFGLQVGGRWYWNEKWGLNLEFSGGKGFGTRFGVSLKM
jgi:hypothetical protein